MGRGKRDLNTVFLKIGLALAVTLGCKLYTFIRNKRIKPSESQSDRCNSSDCNNQGIPGRGSESEHHASHETPSSYYFDPLATDKHEDLHNSMPDKDSYLLPEFNDLVKEFNMTAMNTPPELLNSDSESTQKVSSHEQEVKSLRNMVKLLKEQEQKLEIQLLEYYGLKEQETAVMELHNRLKLNNMEAKLCALKIESLQADNKRLESQMADHNKVLAELEAARAKIKVLKKKLRSEGEQNKEKILDLQQRVQKMQEDELNLCKLKDLEAEVNKLRKSNNCLQVEKVELSRKLEHVQMLATSTSVLEDNEMEKVRKESTHLKKQNEELAKEIEQLQADRCGDVEELVYLRWINACLRYELRNYQPDPGKTMARDLSKTLSPKSEEKAKKLILEYANKEGRPEKGINIPEPDSDQWSSPQSSDITDSGELDDSFVDYSSSKSNYKFFGKLVKFLRGKDTHSHDHHDHVHDHRQSRHSRNSSFGEDMNSCSDNSFWHLGSSKRSMDSQRSIHRHSDVGNSSKQSMDSQRSIHRHSDVGMHKQVDSIAEGYHGGGCLDSPSSSDGRKTELVKYAKVLKDSNPKPTAKYRRRSISFSSF